MKEATQSTMLTEIAAYYASKLEAHGPTPQGVDWNGTDSHQMRHQQFLRLLNGSPHASVIDLGCGFGDFFAFSPSRWPPGPFLGYDIAPTMIEQARRLHGEGDHHRWRIGAEPAEVADFAVASGIFNVKGEVSNHSWRDYVYKTIDLLARAGRHGFAFNVLSMSSDPDRRRPNLYYADPAEMLTHCLSHYGGRLPFFRTTGFTSSR